jgi:hypothetical protein
VDLRPQQVWGAGGTHSVRYSLHGLALMVDRDRLCYLNQNSLPKLSWHWYGSSSLTIFDVLSGHFKASCYFKLVLWLVLLHSLSITIISSKDRDHVIFWIKLSCLLIPWIHSDCFFISFITFHIFIFVQLALTFHFFPANAYMLVLIYSLFNA